MDIQNAYNHWSDSYDTDTNLTRDLDSRVTQAGLGHRSFDSILEIGCGTGKNTVFLAEVGRQVHSLDFSEGMLAQARRKVTAGNVRFSRADLTQRWPCDDAACDLIVCCLVLEHIADLSHIFAEAARTLQVGGRFFINELHPFKQYGGSKARFEQDGQTIHVEAFLHHISDFLHAAQANKLKLVSLEEYWHEEDEARPPRLVSFVFER